MAFYIRADQYRSVVLNRGDAKSPTKEKEKIWLSALTNIEIKIAEDSQSL